MKIRIVLALAALIPLMVACKAQDGSADAIAPTTAAPTPAAAAPESAPAAETAAAPETAPAAQAASEPAASAAPPAAASSASHAPTGPEPVEGKDYVATEGGQPIQPVDGKVEVAEVFNYVCPACASFQPKIASWKATLPSDVNFVYVPAMFGRMWDNYGHAFYAAQALGVQEKTHEALYRAIHVDHTLKGELGMDSDEDIANFYSKYGVDAGSFASAMRSFAVEAKTQRAKQFALRSKVAGTPSLVVNGKYLVKGDTYEDMLRITDQLVARERAAIAK